MAQWKGKIIDKTASTVTIKFSNNKILKFNLLDLDTDFCLITEKPVKCLNVCITKTKEAVSFDTSLKLKVLENTKKNIFALWSNGKWIL